MRDRADTGSAGGASVSTGSANTPAVCGQPGQMMLRGRPAPMPQRRGPQTGRRGPQTGRRGPQTIRGSRPISHPGRALARIRCLPGEVSIDAVRHRQGESHETPVARQIGCGMHCAAALMATAASACSSHNSAGTSGSGASGGTLTIQGDTGNPSLVENFNPFTPSTELHGAFLIYEPLEIPSPVNGAYTPFLATGYKFTNPTTLVYTIRPGVRWSDGKIGRAHV